MEGRNSSRKSSRKSGDFMQQYMSLKCYLHTLLSHKMALALCAQLAHLSVLKLSSELHRGGTGRVQTSDSLHTALWLVRFPPSNKSANSNSRFCLVPPTLTSLKAEGAMYFRGWWLRQHKIQSVKLRNRVVFKHNLRR